MGESVLVLAFSGGGTRAAALSYGILQELRDTPVVVGGESRQLLDEVDLITSVSGGSFTSAYFALFGDRIFEDFEERFLHKKVERSLILDLLKPWNWVRLMRPGFDRSELAIELHPEEIFDRATFEDLVETRGPHVEINAADLAVGNRFEQVGIERPKCLAVVVVDAEVHPEPPFNRSPASPSLAAIIGSVSGVQLYRYNFETLELMRETLEDWAQQLSQGEGRRVTAHLIEVAFQAIEDPEECEFFDEVPTSLSLDDETVDRLIEVGRYVAHVDVRRASSLDGAEGARTPDPR